MTEPRITRSITGLRFGRGSTLDIRQFESGNVVVSVCANGISAMLHFSREQFEVFAEKAGELAGVSAVMEEVAP